jgi:hypothetical protein
MTNSSLPFPALRAHSEAAVALAQQLNAQAIALKREPTTLDTVPVMTVADYGGSGHALSLAVQELDEAVPNGQRIRVECAMRAAKLALVEYEAWLRAKGYNT